MRAGGGTHSEGVQQGDRLQDSLLCPHAFLPGPRSAHFQSDVDHRLV